MRDLFIRFQFFILILICLALFVSSSVLSEDDVELRAKVEELIYIIAKGEAYERDKAFDKAKKMGVKIIPILMEYLDSKVYERKSVAIRLIAVLADSYRSFDYEPVMGKLFSILKNKENEDRWIIASTCGALSEIKDVRVIKPLLDTLEYYDDIDIKASISRNLEKITGKWKFSIVNNYTMEEARQVEKRIKKWYKKNQGKMFFDERGKLRYGDPLKYKPPSKPTKKLIKGYEKIVAILFDVKLNREERDIIEQQLTSHYQKKEYEFIDWLESYIDYTKDQKMTSEAKKIRDEVIEEIKSGDFDPEVPQAWFCGSYESRKKIGIEDPAYELIHRMCLDLFGDHYKEVIEAFE